ncbi:MAG: hypothetical protein JNJ59_20490, partial [Deltaproteobacteria bacterium]|nr:hypothetical protein [Deltaproteobacteria bacterium]
EWLPETALRLRLYRGFAGAKTHEELAAVLGGAVDRYGPPPLSVRNLAGLMAVKLEARALRLTSVALGKDRLVLGLSGEGPLQPIIVAQYAARVHRGPGGRLTPEGKLHLPHPPGTSGHGVEYVREVLRAIADYAANFGSIEAAALDAARQAEARAAQGGGPTRKVEPAPARPPQGPARPVGPALGAMTPRRGGPTVEVARRGLPPRGLPPRRGR